MKILFLEDNDADAQIIKRVLMNSDLGLAEDAIVTVSTRDAFESGLTADINVVLLDLALPGYDGMSALLLSKRKLPDVPVIVLSGSVTDTDMANAIRAGATDAIAKDRTARLPLAIERAIRETLMRQAALREQRVENIGSLAAGICHDLNNVFAPMMMVLGMLHTNARPEERALIDKAMVACRRGAEMVQQILAFAKGSEALMSNLDVPRLVQQITSLLRETFPKNIEVRERILGTGPTVRGNITQLHQVIVNLCVNARDAMPDGGCLLLMVDWPTDRGSLCRIQVKDTGPGMSDELLGKIFMPFFTTKKTGTGLGLALASEIIKAHNGFIEVSSITTQPTGTTFAVFLPAALVDVTHETEIFARQKPTTGRGETILVVDDEQSILDITAMLLDNHGYRPLIATNAIEGLRILTGPERDSINLVITDMFMPLMDGEEFIARLKRLKPEMKCIGISGAERTEIYRADYRLRKPYQVSQFLALIREALDAA